jgi:hypothetical protein
MNNEGDFKNGSLESCHRDTGVDAEMLAGLILAEMDITTGRLVSNEEMRERIREWSVD